MSSPTDIYIHTGTGLDGVAARRRLVQFGPNEPVSSRPTSSLSQILFLFVNPLVIILLVASAISAAVGEVLNASIIALMVLLSVALNFIQTYRSQCAVERIRKETAPTATVLRDGNWAEIHRREVVPGDVISLTAGDLVPADAALFKVRDLHVQEAALTGESLPVEKEAVNLQTVSQDTNDDHKVFHGTSVVSGSGTALVIATGRNTAFGDIAMRLATKPPETEFERGAATTVYIIFSATDRVSYDTVALAARITNLG